MRGLGRVDEQGRACRWRRGWRRSCGRHGRTCPCRTPRPGRDTPASSSTARVKLPSSAGRERAQPGRFRGQHATGDIQIVGPASDVSGRCGRAPSAGPVTDCTSLYGHRPRRGQPFALQRQIVDRIVPSPGALRSMGENIRLFVAQQIEPAARRQEVEAGFRQRQAALAAQQGLELAPRARAGAARRTRRRRAARRLSSGAPQSEVCCCLDSSTPSSSGRGPCRPCRSVKVRTSLAAILVQRTGATVMPSAVLQHGHVEAGEVHQLDDRRVGQQARRGWGSRSRARRARAGRAAPDGRGRRRPRAAPGRAGRDAG